MSLIKLPDGQAVQAGEVVSVRIEEFLPGKWYVYVDRAKKELPRITLIATSEEDAKIIASQIVTLVNQRIG